MNPTQPDPAFVEHLEWQVRTSLRRRERFARPNSAPFARIARTAALCLFCLFGGAGAVLAAGELQQDRERSLHITRAQLEVEMAELRLARAAAELSRLEAAFANAIIGPATVEESRARSTRLTRAAERERLELAETEASGRPANDDLAAPLIDGRDFVSERLRLELTALQEERDHHAEAAAYTEKLFEAGLIAESERRSDRAEVALTEGRARLYRERLELRGRFLRGALDARELLVREQIAILEADVQDRERELLGLDADVSRARQLVGGGLVSSTELEELGHRRELLLRELELLRVERQQWLERSSR